MRFRHTQPSRQQVRSAPLDRDPRQRMQLADVPVESIAYGMVYGMKRTTLYLPLDLKRALERAAATRGCSEAELVRVAIRGLTGDTAPRPRLPLFKSDKPTLAEGVDAALVGFGRR